MILSTTLHVLIQYIERSEKDDIVFLNASMLDRVISIIKFST
jgi:hypothetical protein